MSSSCSTCATALLVAAAVVGTAVPSRSGESYDPAIEPGDFSTKIDNPFFAMPVGKRMSYAGKTEDGLERIEIAITGETRMVMGVETLVYLDRAYLDDELVEETKDFLAQDRQGNVWYFGEEVDNYEDGKLKDHEGAWMAGTDGAKPGIWIKAEHKPDDTYRQEYYQGEAEDMVKIVATGERVTVPAGKFEGCTKTYDWTPLDPESKEHKYYCPAAGGVVLVEDLTTGDRVELVKVETGG